MSALRQGVLRDRNGDTFTVWTCDAFPAVHQFRQGPGSGVRTLRGRLLRDDEAAQLRADACPACSARPAADEEESRVPPALLEGLDIFRTLDRPLLARVARIARIAHAPDGTLLARGEAAGDRFYGILAGQVQITSEASKGVVTVRVAGPGESLPLAALLGEGRLITSAVAMTPLRLVEVPRAPFLELCQQHPEIGHRVYRAIAEILAARYRRTLGRLIDTLDVAAKEPDFSANL